MQPVYASLVLAECPDVLGRKLLPFSLWHSFALDAFGSPVLTHGTADADDVILAAWICSRDHAEGIDYIRNKRAQLYAECEQWGASQTKEQIESAAIALRQYIHDYSHAPIRKATNQDADYPVPWQLSLVHWLCRGDYSHARIVEAWNTSLNTAVYMHTAYAVSQGDESYMSEEMHAALEAARAEAQAGKGAPDGTG